MSGKGLVLYGRRLSVSKNETRRQYNVKAPTTVSKGLVGESVCVAGVLVHGTGHFVGVLSSLSYSFIGRLRLSKFFLYTFGILE